MLNVLTDQHVFHIGDTQRRTVWIEVSICSCPLLHACMSLHSNSVALIKRGNYLFTPIMQHSSTIIVPKLFLYGGFLGLNIHRHLRLYFFCALIEFQIVEVVVC